MGLFLKLKYALRNLRVRILASLNVPFRPTTVQMPNLALIEIKLITVLGLKKMYVFTYSRKLHTKSVVLLEAIHCVSKLACKIYRPGSHWHVDLEAKGSKSQHLDKEKKVRVKQ
jgi:hypothetical protein